MADQRNRVTEAGRSGHVGFLVPRPHIMAKLAAYGEQAGVTFLCAPRSFGKTAVLLERVMCVRSEEGRGVARIVDARTMSGDELLRQLASFEAELDHASRPLVAVDNMPAFPEEAEAEVSHALRRMRDEGFEIIVACAPYASGLMERMGDSAKMHAQTLKVQTKEYPSWAEELVIAPSVDIYGLTQGIPSLVSALREMTERPEDSSALSGEAVQLYREAFLEPAPAVRQAMMAMIVLREGTLTDLDCSGFKIDERARSRIARDYPMFGLGDGRDAFRCLDMPGAAHARLCRDIADREPSLVGRCARALMRMRRAGDAAELCDGYMSRADAAEVVARFPVEFSLAGRARFVRDVVSDALVSADGYAGSGVGIVLACYAAALVVGDYRTAREAALELSLRADRIASEVDARAWSCALACQEAWGGGRETSLPQIRHEPVPEDEMPETCALRLHMRVLDAVRRLDAASLTPELRDALDGGASEEVDLSRMMLVLDACLVQAFAGTAAMPAVEDAAITRAVERLESLGLQDMAALARMAGATRSLLGLGSVSDERAFNDAGVVAVRRSDMRLQLFCMIAEGWQNLVSGQAVNARFRGQQALKLMHVEEGFLYEWARLLERCAYVRNTSLVTLREDADRLDLDGGGASFAEAWAVAIHLSSVRHDAELSYWYSLNRETLLDARFRMPARLALACFAGERLALARLIPEKRRAEFVPAVHADSGPSVQIAMGDARLALGQVNFRLFGGFRVEKNGYALTDRGWRRRRACVLAARLALCLGTYVQRSAVLEEMWPDQDFEHAREGLYVTLSALRKALGQHEGGPQYLQCQGQALALNPDFVSSDTARFDLLARDVLLKRKGITAPQVIEACLSLEQLYKGPLYVPDRGAAAYFVKARGDYLSKFVDCMISGCTLAVEEGMLSSAAWLIQAALKHAPTREDVIRCAMRVLDLQGRRREIVELYNSHLHYLAQELGLYPERETRELYERIVGGAMEREML